MTTATPVALSLGGRWAVRVGRSAAVLPTAPGASPAQSGTSAGWAASRSRERSMGLVREVSVQPVNAGCEAQDGRDQQQDAESEDAGIQDGGPRAHVGVGHRDADGAEDQ